MVLVHPPIPRWWWWGGMENPPWADGVLSPPPGQLFKLGCKTVEFYFQAKLFGFFKVHFYLSC